MSDESVVAPLRRPNVAAPLAPGLRELSAAVLAEVADTAAMRLYRATAAGRGTTADAICSAHGLEARDIGPDITAFCAPGVTPRVRVLFFHGGGLIAGNRLDGADVLARHSADVQLELWSADYPLTPETPHDQIVAHLVDVTRQAAADGIPVVLSGYSAGGGLAASVAFECRDLGIPVLGTLLMCPMLDSHDTASAAQFATDPAWSRTSNRACWDAALEGSASVAPGDRTDLEDLPPTYLDVGSAEVFRDSVAAFAGALWAEGNQAELHVWSGAFHASESVIEGAAVSRDVHRARKRWLLRLLDDEL